MDLLELTETLVLQRAIEVTVWELLEASKSDQMVTIAKATGGDIICIVTATWRVLITTLIELSEAPVTLAVTTQEIHPGMVEGNGHGAGGGY